jgi:hypothetical protein
VASLHSTIKYLKAEITKYKGQETKRQLADVALSLTPQNTIVSDSEQRAELVRCNKDLLSLLKDIQLKRATPKVVDLSSSGSNQQLQLQRTELEALQKRAQSLKSKVQTLAVNISGTSVYPDTFNSFPSTSLTKVCLLYIYM